MRSQTNPESNVKHKVFLLGGEGGGAGECSNLIFFILRFFPHLISKAILSSIALHS